MIRPPSIPAPPVARVAPVPSETLRKDFQAKHQAAEQAAHAWACSLEVGPERELAFEVYENVRTALRVGS